jgi:hypothetical protein
MPVRYFILFLPVTVACKMLSFVFHFGCAELALRVNGNRPSAD